MYLPQNFKFDCSYLLDEIELAYQELCDILELPYNNINRQLMRTILAYLLEDTINKLTSPKFRDPVNLTKNLINNYLEHTVKLDKVDLVAIDEIFIQPMMAETLVVLGKLTQSFDRYYSKWEVKESDNFPTMIINYQGDYRIDEWHKIQDVPSNAPVVVKQHRIRYDDIANAVRDNLITQDDLAVSDITIIVDKIIEFYAGRQIDELYKEIVIYLKIVHGFKVNEHNYTVVKQTKDILKTIESIPSFSRFKEDAAVAESIYHSQTRSQVLFDIVMPNKNLNRADQRKEILDEIDRLGYVTGDIPGKVEIVYG